MTHLSSAHIRRAWHESEAAARSTKFAQSTMQGLVRSGFNREVTLPARIRWDQ